MRLRLEGRPLVRDHLLRAERAGSIASYGKASAQISQIPDPILNADGTLKTQHPTSNIQYLEARS